MPLSIRPHRRNVRGDRDPLSTYFGPISPSVGGDKVNRIILYSALATTYAKSDTGMAAAIVAAIAADTIWVPSGTLADDYTIPANVAVVGESIVDMIFSGQITLSDGSVLENISIVRSENSASPIYGIVEGAGAISAEMRDVYINVSNADNAAYGVYMNNGGTIKAYNCEILAETGSVGYAAYVVSADFYQYGGRAVGTVTLEPYFTS